MLLVFYEWKKELERKDYVVKDVMLHKFSEEDLIVIKKDWEIIINKIKDKLKIRIYFFKNICYSEIDDRR